MYLILQEDLHGTNLPFYPTNGYKGTSCKSMASLPQRYNPGNPGNRHHGGSYYPVHPQHVTHRGKYPGHHLF